MTMPKTLLRLIAALLIPCLIADPATCGSLAANLVNGGALASPPAPAAVHLTVHGSRTTLFQSQALLLPLASIRHSFSSSGWVTRRWTSVKKRTQDWAEEHPLWAELIPGALEGAYTAVVLGVSSNQGIAVLTLITLNAMRHLFVGIQRWDPYAHVWERIRLTDFEPDLEWTWKDFWKWQGFAHLISAYGVVVWMVFGLVAPTWVTVLEVIGLQSSMHLWSRAQKLYTDHQLIGHRWSEMRNLGEILILTVGLNREAGDPMIHEMIQARINRVRSRMLRRVRQLTFQKKSADGKPLPLFHEVAAPLSLQAYASTQAFFQTIARLERDREDPHHLGALAEWVASFFPAFDLLHFMEAHAPATKLTRDIAQELYHQVFETYRRGKDNGILVLGIGVPIHLPILTQEAFRLARGKIRRRYLYAPQWKRSLLTYPLILKNALEMRVYSFLKTWRLAHYAMELSERKDGLAKAAWLYWFKKGWVSKDVQEFLDLRRGSEDPHDDPRSLSTLLAYLQSIRLGFGTPEVLPQEVALRQGSDVIHVGIHGRASHVDFVIAQEGGRHPEVNVILILNEQDIQLDRSGDSSDVALTRGLVFHQGRPVFVRFDPPVKLDYLVDYTRRMYRDRFKLRHNVPGPGTDVDSKYFDNKVRMHLILDAKGVRVPTSWPLTELDEDGLLNVADIQKPLDAFIQEVGPVVMKPIDLSGGRGIVFADAGHSHAAAAAAHQLLKAGDQALIQERIEPPYIPEGDQRHDWNLRLLLAYDATRGGPVVSDIVARVGQEGGPINLSLTAQPRLLEEVIEALGYPPSEYVIVRQKVEALALEAYRALQETMVEDGVISEGQPPTHFMGVDIMVARENDEWVPYIIELNSYASGGMYDLEQRLRVLSEQGIAISEDRFGQSVRDWVNTMVVIGRSHRQKENLEPPDSAPEKSVTREPGIEGWPYSGNILMEYFLKSAVIEPGKWVKVENLRALAEYFENGWKGLQDELDRLTADPQAHLLIRENPLRTDEWDYRIDISPAIRAIVWRRLGSVGTLDHLRSMEPIDFAFQTGATFLRRTREFGYRHDRAGFIDERKNSYRFYLDSRMAASMTRVDEFKLLAARSVILHVLHDIGREVDSKSDLIDRAGIILKGFQQFAVLLGPAALDTAEAILQQTITDEKKRMAEAKPSQKKRYQKSIAELEARIQEARTPAFRNHTIAEWNTATGDSHPVPQTRRTARETVASNPAAYTPMPVLLTGLVTGYTPLVILGLAILAWMVLPRAWKEKLSEEIVLIVPILIIDAINFANATALKWLADFVALKKIEQFIAGNPFTDLMVKMVLAAVFAASIQEYIVKSKRKLSISLQDASLALRRTASPDIQQMVNRRIFTNINFLWVWINVGTWTTIAQQFWETGFVSSAFLISSLLWVWLFNDSIKYLFLKTWVSRITDPQRLIRLYPGELDLWGASPDDLKIKAIGYRFSFIRWQHELVLWFDEPYILRWVGLIFPWPIYIVPVPGSWKSGWDLAKDWIKSLRYQPHMTPVPVPVPGRGPRLQDTSLRAAA
jgi:hypothetical protein